MASSSKDSAPTVENSDEDVISMVDVLKEEEQLEEYAAAVLGGSDEKNCTYPMGYVRRQALYACKTCCTSEKDLAGVCLACSLECHEGHELYELFTKRNFRCDCGNSRFPSVTCKLEPVKDELNTENHYNQNFLGLYCTCIRPYPDPEDEVEDEMIQCVICEDWYHGRHLETSVPEDFFEMICKSCMQKHEFLWAYSVHCEDTKQIELGQEKDDVDVVSTEKVECCDGISSEDKSVILKATTSQDTKNVTKKQLQKQKEKRLNGKTKSEACSFQNPDCLLKQLQAREIIPKKGAAFWNEDWRANLCTCASCTEMYEERGISYLTDRSDTVLAYEEKGKQTQSPNTSHQDREASALLGMNRVQQIEMVQGYMDMKSQLSEYLKKFAENGKVVREEDIREFFSQMQARKRQRTGGPPQYFCH
ncbi:hypothetical protein ACJMK2_036555 [Sinanodonta woodiana]|uniref:UBR-type domain-containing protein n=1 Tax=Sinanodonta woodiana TaxID=1069815 RepID=A0ABD3WIS1_SINWO